MEKSEIQDQALQTILSYDRCSVNISVGTGKTLLGLNHMNEHYTDYCRFLVAAPKKSIFKSWTEEIEKFNMQHLLPHITFTTYLSLSKQDSDYDVVYLDEMHSLLSSHEFWLSMYRGKILGMTGTKPKYRKSTKGKLVDEYCPVVYNYSTDEAIEDNILNDYEIKIHMLSLSTDKSILMKTKDKQWYTSEQDSYNYWTRRIDDATSAKDLQILRIMRMKAMMEFPSKEYLTKILLGQITNKCIIFANTKEQCDRISPNRYYSDYSLSDSTLLAFKSGEINTLVCINQLSEGINIPNLKESIILHSFANERKANQKIGRCLRLAVNDKAIINILVFKDTVDESWCKNALSNLDQSKIKYV